MWLTSFYCIVSNLLILWHVDPLLGKVRETNNETIAIAKQQLRYYAIVLESLLGSGPHAIMEVLSEAVFSVVPLRGYITRPTELKQLVTSVQWSGASWLASE
jgi:hypothetical protein